MLPAGHNACSLSRASFVAGGSSAFGKRVGSVVAASRWAQRAPHYSFSVSSARSSALCPSSASTSSSLSSVSRISSPLSLNNGTALVGLRQGPSRVSSPFSSLFSSTRGQRGYATSSSEDAAKAANNNSKNNTDNATKKEGAKAGQDPAQAKGGEGATPPPPGSGAKGDVAGGGSDKSRAVQTAAEGSKLPVVTKVVEGAKTAGYSVVLLGALGAMAATLFYLFSMAFSTTSPQNVFGQTCNILKKDAEVIKALGNAIKCYGEERGRTRKDVKWTEYTDKRGNEHLQVVYYAEGEQDVAEVHADVLKGSGKLYSLVLYLPIAGRKLVYTNEKVFKEKLL
ncbi:Mitochondrial import inner membrane translocase subunit Tim21 [Balamuthia mandrillaris]